MGIVSSGRNHGSLLKSAQATVTVTVAPLTGTRSFPVVSVQAIILASSLSAEFDPPSVGVLLAGPLPALGAVTLLQITAVVDAAGKGPGTYPVDVTVRVPATVTAQSVQPTRVMLTIRTRSG